MIDRMFSAAASASEGWALKAGAKKSRDVIRSGRGGCLAEVGLMKILCACVLFLAGGAGAAAADANDYPTEARADYVFVCMKANGETRDALKRCSCSIDVIASLLPYERYVAAETVASMSQAQGQIGSLFRASEQARATAADLRRAQAEAEIRCF